MSATQPVRRRDAGATREAILASARLAFIRSGYDGAGVREIAEGAGVTAMLVNRYFGSKERLFADVAEPRPDDLWPRPRHSARSQDDAGSRPARRLFDHATIDFKRARRGDLA